MNDLKARVHELYWKKDCNCAKTMLLCLCEHFCIPLQEQTLHAATGMHGAGRFRAQCGLVEGALMFIGIAGRSLRPEQQGNRGPLLPFCRSLHGTLRLPCLP